MTATDPAGARPRREAVLISGMHRSGTSAASRAVSFLGYSQPQLLARPDPANPRGYWQSTHIVQLNEEMLASLGWSWDHTPLLTRPGLSPTEAETEILAHLSTTWMERAREAIRISFREDARRVVCKDPRLSLFPAFWQAAFEAEGFAVQHLLVFRDPEDVAASLHRQQQMARGPALRTWLTYNLRALTQVEIAATVDFAELVQRPRRAVNAIGRVLGVGPLDAAAAVELGEFIDRAPASEQPGEGALTQPKLVTETLLLLRHWRGPGQPRTDRRAESLRDDYTDAQVLFGRVRRLPTLDTRTPAYKVDTPAAPSQAGAATAERSLVLHYHLFKNAGTSVDVVLEGNFGGAWRSAEFPGRSRRANHEQVEAWIGENPTVEALSSHSARGPLPRLGNVHVCPVLFIRHPIDRIRSAFEVERRQLRDSPGQGQPNRSATFRGYIEAHLRREARDCRNFQTERLSDFAPGQAAELERALRIVAEWPFIGLVEDFAGSMVRMEAYLRRSFPAFRAFGAKANVWREGRTLEERLDDVRAEIGPELWRELVDANRDDLQLFAAVADRYDLATDAVLPD